LGFVCVTGAGVGHAVFQEGVDPHLKAVAAFRPAADHVGVFDSRGGDASVLYAARKAVAFTLGAFAFGALMDDDDLSHGCVF